MIVLIGGTGTLGKELARQLVGENITIFSRDEQKQQAMKRDFPNCRYIIGDVRDKDSILAATKGAKVVFLLAAMKHIDVVEANPFEAIKTNVLGAVNVAEACEANGVQYCLYSNTDKAVLPITTYGYTKALAQDYLLSRNKVQSEVSYSAYNWGNVLMSNGSAVNFFADCIRKGLSVPLTHMDMSRFWITIEHAVSFMLANFRYASKTSAMIPPIKAAKVYRIINAIADVIGKPAKIEIVGMRGIEKMYEVLESNHSGCLRSDTCEQYSDEELRELLRGVVHA